MKPWLRLIRLPLAPTAICDSLACGLLAYAAAGHDLPVLPDWLALAATSFLLYSFGMAANDYADRTVDRMKNPDRPLPAGHIAPAAALVLLLLLAGASLLVAGGPIGSVQPVSVAVVFALLYDFALKRRVLPGAASMGCVRFANASIAVWPLVLDGSVSWLLLLPPACIGLYSAAVTVFSTTEDFDAPGRVTAGRILAALAFGGAATVAWVVGGLPTLGVAVAFGVASSTLFGRTPRPGPRKRQVLEMLLGLYWLAYVISTGTHAGGSHAAWAAWSLAGLPVAWGLAIASQLMVRWLRPSRPPASA